MSLFRKLMHVDFAFIDEITFSGKSYVVWKVTVPMERRMHLGLEIKTVQTNARLMYVEGIVDYSILEVW